MAYRLPDQGPVRVRTSNTAAAAPTAAELEEGELALNAADGKIYYQTSAGSIDSISAGFEEPPIDGNTYGRKDGEWVDLASAAALQFRQGTNADRLAMDPVPAAGEPIYTTDTERLFIGDGVTVGGNGLVGNTDRYVICQPGDNLTAKYAEAKILTPGGAALSATNRGALIIFPGSYAGTGTLAVDTNFVDIIGLGSAVWNPKVTLTGYGAIEISATDVLLKGIRFAAGTIRPTVTGGAARVIENCFALRIYDCGGLALVDGVPSVFDGTIIGCEAFGSSSNGHLLGGGSNSNVFVGRAINCKFNGSFCRGAVFQGTAQYCIRTVNPVGLEFQTGPLQGRFEHCIFEATNTADLPARSSEMATLGAVPAGFAATCTISNASPAVVTCNGHQLLTGMRIRFTTTDTLPTGLNTTTTYYVRRIDANTFSVAATAAGALINTTGDGAGTHTIVIPPGKEGGWYSFCVTKDGEFTST